MKETKNLPPRVIPQTETFYTCSRCGAPAGTSALEEFRETRGKRIVIAYKENVEIDVGVSAPDKELVVIERTAVRVTIEQEDMEGNYGYTASASAVVIDCCETCWNAIAVPALMMAGFNVREEDRSW